MSTLTGRTLGGYTILEELGRGAMGVVFKARQLSMDRFVAIKFLPNRLARDEKIVARFMREARAAGQLTHPNIVSVHDVGVIEGLHYLAMEFVDGNSVQKRMAERGSFSEKETLDIAAQVAEALRCAHTRGILHRDIKPDNFLIDSAGRVRLADLGLARFLSEGGGKEGDLTQDGAAMGTPHYMAPEQCRGAAVDPRSDLYSLGASMYVMATGKTPFQGNSAAAVMVKTLTENPRPLREVGPQLSAGFIALVEKLMAKDPTQRFADAAELLQAMEQCRTGQYRPVTAANPAGTEGGSKLRLVLYGAGSAFAALIIIGFLTRNRAGDPIPEPKHAATPRQSELVTSSKEAPPSEKTPQPAAEPPDATPPAEQTEPGKHAVMDGDGERDVPRRKEFEALLDGIRELERRNPAAFIARLEEFQKNAKQLHRFVQKRLDLAIEKAREHLQKYREDWETLKLTSDEQIAAGSRHAALADLYRFAQRHEDSAESAQAQKKAGVVVAALQHDALQAAAAGRFEEARKMLSPILSTLDKAEPQLAEQCRKTLEHIGSDERAALALAQEDAQALRALLQAAAAQAREPDSEGKHFRPANAAGVLRKGAAGLKTPGARTSAGFHADLYTRAAAVMENMKTRLGEQPVELAKFNNLTNVRVTAWTDAGLKYVVQALGEQLVTWKRATGEHLLQLAEALKIGSNGGAQDFLDGAALAFICGDTAAMEAKLLAAVTADPGLKPMAEALLPKAALAAVKLDDSEIAAEQLYDAALAAAEKNDKELARKHVNSLVLKHAETKFVKSRVAELQNLQLGILPQKAERKEREADGAKRDEKSSAEDEFKKLGWEVIAGEWTYDPKQKVFRVPAGGQLSAPSASEAKVAFTLGGEDASICVLLHESDETFPARFGGTGYGAQIQRDGVVNFVPKWPTKKIGEKWRDNYDYAPPFRQDLIKAPMQGRHTLQVALREQGMEISINGRSASFPDKVRGSGTTQIVLKGAVQIEAPTFKK